MSELRATTSSETRSATDLIELIQEQIASGELQPGDRILSERRLSDLYDVPLHAVRVAVNELKDAGVLASRPKSGVFVAASRTFTRRPIRAAASVAASEPVSADGFNLFDVVEPTTQTLHFVVGAWHESTQSFWRQVCRGYSVVEPGVEVVPHFPRSAEEYLRMQTSADIFTSTHTSCFKSGVLGEVVAFERDELEAVGIADRYVDSVMDVEGRGFGVPLNATMLVGFLDTQRLSAAQVRQIESSSDLLQAMQLLADAVAGQSDVGPLNFFPVRSFNPMQWLFAQGHPIVDFAAGRVLLDREEVRAQLEHLAQFLAHNRAAFSPAAMAEPGRSTLATIDFTYSGMHQNEPGRFRLWSFPIAEQGARLEGVNFGMVSRRSVHQQQAKQFLLYLASPAVQELMGETLCEYSISARVSDPFKTMAAEDRAQMHAMREQAVVMREFVPGYIRLVEEIYLPAIKQWFFGQMSTSDFCLAVTSRGNEMLESYSPVGGLSGRWRR